jgi:hypothetical protein
VPDPAIAVFTQQTANGFGVMAVVNMKAQQSSARGYGSTDGASAVLGHQHGIVSAGVYAVPPSSVIVFVALYVGIAPFFRAVAVGLRTFWRRAAFDLHGVCALLAVRADPVESAFVAAKCRERFAFIAPGAWFCAIRNIVRAASSHGGISLSRKMFYHVKFSTSTLHRGGNAPTQGAF